MAKKSKQEITSIEEAKQAMSDINKYDNALAGYYEQEANAIARIRSRFHTGVVNMERQALEAAKKERIKQLEQFAKKTRKDWEGKSIQTPFGSFGFRKGQPCVVLVKKVCKTFEDALDRVKSAMPGYVRIREEVNKEMILNDSEILLPEELEAAGLKIEQKEPFYIKTLSTERLDEASKKLKSA